MRYLSNRHIYPEHVIENVMDYVEVFYYSHNNCVLPLRQKEIIKDTIMNSPVDARWWLKLLSSSYVNHPEKVDNFTTGAAEKEAFRLREKAVQASPTYMSKRTKGSVLSQKALDVGDVKNFVKWDYWLDLYEPRMEGVGNADLLFSEHDDRLEQLAEELTSQYFNESLGGK